MKNRPWKQWKTRKVSFIVVCLVWLSAAILGLSGQEVSIDILDFIYKSGVWLLTFGITLVLSDKVADKLLSRFGNKNGGEDE